MGRSERPAKMKVRNLLHSQSVLREGSGCRLGAQRAFRPAPRHRADRFGWRLSRRPYSDDASCRIVDEENDCVSNTPIFNFMGWQRKATLRCDDHLSDVNWSVERQKYSNRRMFAH